MNSLFNIGGKVKIPTYLSPVRQCYSLRKAQKDYTGDIGIVKRMSDDATLTVGFNSNNELDTDAVDAFDDGSDLRMIEWYNQGSQTSVSSVTNADDLQCPLLKRNGDYFYLNGKKTLYFEDGGRMWHNVRVGGVQKQNIGIVYAGTTDQWLAGLSLHDSWRTVTTALKFDGNKNRSYKFMAASGTEFQEHSESIPFNQQQISLGYYNDVRYQSVNGIIETSPREIFLGIDAANFTTINSYRPRNGGGESYIQEVFIRGDSNFRPDLVEEANKYYNTF